MEQNIIDQLKEITTATATMQLLRRGIRRCGMAGVRPLRPGQGRIVGEAYTLRLIPWREDLSTPAVMSAPDSAPRAAIEEVPAGAILIVDARGVTTAGTVGDILITRLLQKGVAAFVTDGAVRDGEGVIKTGFPVWLGGVAAPSSMNEHAAGDRQVPIGCGGVAVIPGDVLVCDEDGVVVIPRALAAEVARDGLEEERLEAWIQERVEEGRAIPGLYPPNEKTLAEYEAWTKSQEKPGAS